VVVVASSDAFTLSRMASSASSSLLLRAFLTKLISSLEKLDERFANLTKGRFRGEEGIEGVPKSPKVEGGDVTDVEDLRWFVDVISSIADEARICVDSLTNQLALDAVEASGDEEALETSYEISHDLDVKISTRLKYEGGGGGDSETLSLENTKDVTTVVALAHEKVGHSYATRRQKGKTKGVASLESVPTGSGNKSMFVTKEPTDGENCLKPSAEYASEARVKAVTATAASNDETMVTAREEDEVEIAMTTHRPKSLAMAGSSHTERAMDTCDPGSTPLEGEIQSAKETPTPSKSTTSVVTTNPGAETSSNDTKENEAVDNLDLSWMRDIPTKPNKVECLLCNKIFTRKYCMNTHMILKHSTAGGVKCHVEGCGRVCASQSHFERHYENIHGEQRHKRMAEREKRRREAKERKSDGEAGGAAKNRYMCHICPKLCSRLEYLRNHVALVHEGKTKQKCPKCGRGFLKPRDLARHKCPAADAEIVEGEGGKIPVFKTPCPYCGKRFTKQWIKPHISIEHKGEKEQCPICKRQFSCKGSLKLHYRNLHEGIRAKCPHCDQSFRDGWRLKMHVSSEHEGKRFKCEDCGKEYRSKDNLGRHRKIHAGVRFQCHICQASFGQKAPLTRHIKRKHGGGDGSESPETDYSNAPKTSSVKTVSQHLQAQQLQQQQPQTQHDQVLIVSQNRDKRWIQDNYPPASSEYQHPSQRPLILTSAPLRVADLGAILQTTNGQTLTLSSEQWAQLSQQLEGGLNANLGVISGASVDMQTAEKGNASTGNDSASTSSQTCYALTAAEVDHHDVVGGTVMHAIPLDEASHHITVPATQHLTVAATKHLATAVPATTFRGAAATKPLAIPLNQLTIPAASISGLEATPIVDQIEGQTLTVEGSDKEAKFYLIPSGAWPL